ncbi:hypothetical protein DXG01_014992 [Tephrocybe rancida]|nr:hypothetical protein DXG01_014992 [Tephrocybe rancida]
MLEVTAMCMATDRNGGLIAAAIDRGADDNVTFVVAKNENSDTDDQKVSEEFLHTLQSSQSFEDVLRFVACHCRGSFNKWLADLRASFIPEVADLMANYVYEEIEKEFPARHVAARFLDATSDKPVCEVLADLVTFCQTAKNLSSDDTLENIHLHITKVVLFALVLRQSRFVKHIMFLYRDPPLLYKLDLFLKALNRICVFRHLAPLMDFVKENTVTIRWAQNLVPIPGYSERHTCRKPSLTMKWFFDKYLTPFPEMSKLLSASTRRLRHNQFRIVLNYRTPGILWEEPTTVQTCIHPEVRIALDPALAHLPLRLIGCSTFSCLCCTLWLAALSRFDPQECKWIASRCAKEVDLGWALPGVVTGLDKISSLDEQVVAGVESEVLFRVATYGDAYDWSHE